MNEIDSWSEALGNRMSAPIVVKHGGDRRTVEHTATQPRNIPASAPTDRKTRRALVKALGNRQFKKLYRTSQA